MKQDNLTLIIKMRFGSHLYGTVTEDSDLDYKGVFLPTKEQVLLGKIPKSYTENTKGRTGEKNTPQDIDVEIYSLHYFIELACQGQTVALDMLHAPREMLISTSPIWDRIVENRSRFYTKNLKAFIGYARHQAAKYGIKGSRLNAAREVISLLESWDDSIQLMEIWNELPSGEHIHFLDQRTPNDLRQYQVVGKVFQETVRVGYVLPILKKFNTEYGKRAEMAANNQGIDWKAISHAFRAAFQVRQLLTEGTITFPLKEAEFLRGVKNGKCDYLTVASPKLEELMDEVEELAKGSTLPERVDRKFWDHFLIETLVEYLF